LLLGNWWTTQQQGVKPTTRTARTSRIPRSGTAMTTNNLELCFKRGLILDTQTTLARHGFGDTRQFFFFSWKLVDGTTAGGRTNDKEQQETTEKSGTAIATNPLELHFKKGVSLSFACFVLLEIVERTLMTSKKDIAKSKWKLKQGRKAAQPPVVDDRVSQPRNEVQRPHTDGGGAEQPLVVDGRATRQHGKALHPCGDDGEPLAGDCETTWPRGEVLQPRAGDGDAVQPLEGQGH
jgi:hypothetical protein